MRRRLLLLAAVITLLSFGAIGVALRDEAEPGEWAFRPDVAPVLTVLFGLALVTFVVLLFVSRGADKPAGQRRSRSWAGMVGGLAAAALLFYLAVTYGPDPRNDPFGEGGGPGRGTGNPLGAERGPEAGTSLTAGLVLAAVLVLLVVGPAVVLWSRSRRERSSTPATTAQDLRLVIAEGQAALAGTDEPREAVISAYAAMEAALIRAGLDRRIADTPTALLRRAGDSDLLGPAATTAAERLTGLFERARFSEHPLPDGVKEDALAALRRIDQDLAAAVAAEQARTADAPADSTAVSPAAPPSGPPPGSSPGAGRRPGEADR